MSKPFDATLNALIDAHADDWAAFLAARVGLPLGPVTAIDTDLSVTHQADRLFRVDGPDPAVLHLELESSGRLGIPTELLRYNVAAHGVTGLPVSSVLILLRPKATATDLTGTLELRAAGAVYLTFRYTVVRLWQEPMGPLLNAGVGLAPLALLTNEADADLPAAFERFNERLRSPDVPPEVRDKLLGATFVLGGLRYPSHDLVDLYMSLHNILEDSTTYQLLMGRGEARGRQNTVLAQGRKRFGPPAAQAEAALKAVTDLDRLGRIAERIFDANSWDDLLATE
jgi:hypothetical protein